MILSRVLPTALVAMALICGNASFAQAQEQGQAADFKTLEEKVSYIIGYNIGQDVSSQQLNLNLAILYKGIQDASAGKDNVLSPEEIQAVMTEFEKVLVQKQQEKFEAMAKENKEKGEAFLAANQNKEGVKTLESGLQYKVIKAGEGESPTAESRVKVHYKGTFIDGTEFDSSYSRGQPAVFGASQVIRGWTEALTRMKVGGKWELYIPSNLAYGDQGNGGIGPNQLLIFEVELLEIVQ